MSCLMNSEMTHSTASLKDRGGGFSNSPRSRGDPPKYHVRTTAL